MVSKILKARPTLEADDNDVYQFNYMMLIIQEGDELFLAKCHDRCLRNIVSAVLWGLWLDTIECKG